MTKNYEEKMKLAIIQVKPMVGRKTKAEITRKLHEIIFGKDCPKNLADERGRVSILLACTVELGLESDLSVEKGDGRGDIRQAMRWGSAATLIKRNKDSTALLELASKSKSIKDFVTKASIMTREQFSVHAAYGYFKIAGRIS